MKKEAGMSLIEFKEKFNNEEQCRKYLIELRLKNGYKCPKCGWEKYSTVSTRTLIECNKCNYQMSATRGTVMDKTRIRLEKWFWAIYMMGTDKRGCSAMKLSKDLSLPYNTAWYLHKRLQSEMGSRDEQYMLDGIIQINMMRT